MLLDLGSPVGGRPSAARHSALEGTRLDVTRISSDGSKIDQENALVKRSNKKLLK